MLVKRGGFPLPAAHNVGATMPESLDTSQIPLRTHTLRQYYMVSIQSLAF